MRSRNVPELVRQMGVDVSRGLRCHPVFLQHPQPGDLRHMPGKHLPNMPNLPSHLPDVRDVPGPRDMPNLRNLSPVPLTEAVPSPDSSGDPGLVTTRLQICDVRGLIGGTRTSWQCPYAELARTRHGVSPRRHPARSPTSGHLIFAQVAGPVPYGLA